MKKITAQAAISLVGCMLANGQGRPIDWPSFGADAQRTGWEKADSRITKDNVKDFTLVLKRQLDNAQKGPHSLTPPVVLGLLISYRGFKELAFVAGSSDHLWSIDVDVDRIFWQKHFDSKSQSPASGACAGGSAITPALIPPINFGQRPRPGGGGARPPGLGAAPGSGAATAVANATAPTAGRGILAAGGFGAPRPVFAVSSDGKLHLMNTSTGDDVAPPIPFLPAGSKAASLTVTDNTVYATTDPACGPGGVWALDLMSSEAHPTIASYPLKEGAVSHEGGLAIGNDGTVYVQSNSLVALSAKTLKPAATFAIPGAPTRKTASTPVVFAYKGRDLIATAGPDGRLYLLDSKSLETPLAQSPVLGDAIGAGLSSWQDTAGTRYIFAPVWGKAGSDATHGAIVAFKLEEKEGKPALTQAWVSRDIPNPEPPVITSGVVFALATGDKNATLYGLDAETGKELYSTGNQVTAPANLTGVTLANGRVFFTTTDNTLWGFGIYMER